MHCNVEVNVIRITSESHVFNLIGLLFIIVAAFLNIFLYVHTALVCVWDSICERTASNLVASFENKIKKSSSTDHDRRLRPPWWSPPSLRNLRQLSAQLLLLFWGVNKWLEEVKQSRTRNKVRVRRWWKSHGFSCGVQNYIDVCKFWILLRRRAEGGVEGWKALVAFMVFSGLRGSQ